ncbi:MAG: DUF1828 domain-containing protein [Candidatus Kuenenia sp.]|nr:DUF1828 domain-containing protein [Candidatus Kuenenia hertensis]
MIKLFDELKIQFNNRVSLREKRPKIYQLLAPIYHEDGDMIDIFLELPEAENQNIRISDQGMTLMRLSYTFDIDTPNKEKIFNRILKENHVSEENGNLYIDTNINSLYPTLMHFAQVIGKISNMRLYKREVIHSLFFEMLEEFIETKLQKYKPIKKYYPVPEHEEYEVDYCFNSRPKPIFLLGVNSSSRAKLATISCLKFMNENINFRSVIILENIDVLGKKDIARLMSVSDKEFPSFDDFKENGEKYFERELQS